MNFLDNNWCPIIFNFKLRTSEAQSHAQNYFEKILICYSYSSTDLYQIRVGVKRRVKYFPRFDEDTKIKKEAVTDVIQNIEKLALGRIDAFINSETQGDYLVAISGFQDKFEKVQVIKGYDRAHFGISKRSKFISQAADFEKVLTQMIEEGKVDAIKRHFMSQIVVRKPIKKQ